MSDNLPSTVETIADALVDELSANDNLVVPIANGEPPHLLDALEARASSLTGVRVHQMHALRDRPYIRGEYRGQLEHVSWFLSYVTRPAYRAGQCSFSPANFSEVPQFLSVLEPAAVLAAASPPDQNGFFSLGVCADYSAALIGKTPFILEVNPNMPQTHGRNRVHRSQVKDWFEAESDLIEVAAKDPSPVDLAIAQQVADRIPDGATIQLGIGAIPGAVAQLLRDHADLGVHTELLSDPIIDLVEAGAVTGLRKRHRRGEIVTTFALGSKQLYDFCHDNAFVRFHPVDEVNDPRKIGQEPAFVSINSTLQVDLFGQCASETIGTNYYSGSGGQADFARGAQYSDGGHGFVVMRSTAKNGTVSKIVSELDPGAVVTTPKNTVDKIVTEFGVAELEGRTLEQRAKALIAIAAPAHRDELLRAARRRNLIRT